MKEDAPMTEIDIGVSTKDKSTISGMSVI